VSVAVPAALLAVLVAGDGDADDSTAARGACPMVPAGASRAEVGSEAPDFALATLDGECIRLRDERGRAVVLTFFASWCNPCEQEMPLLESAAREYGDALSVLAVSYQEALRSDAEDFVDRLGVTYPAMFDAEREVADRYGVRAIPQTFFIDAEGIVRDRVFGITTEAALDEPLRALLARD